MELHNLQHLLSESNYKYKFPKALNDRKIQIIIMMLLTVMITIKIEN